MKRPVKVGIGIIMAVTFLLGTIGLAIANRGSIFPIKQDTVIIQKALQPSHPPDPITLLAAWDIAAQYADKQSDHPVVVQMVSIDSVTDSPSFLGKDGKRRAWQVIMSSDQTERWLTIADGEITQVIERMPSGLKSVGEKPILDSPEALNLALRFRPELAPANGEGLGYHFALEFDQEVGEPELKVIGSTDIYTAYVALNPTTKIPVMARRLTLTGGGILYSEDGGDTWKPSNLVNTFISDIAADPWQPDQAYAIGSKANRVWLFQTRNGGRDWEKVGELPNSAGDWPYCIGIAGKDQSEKVILVGVHSGLWTSADGKEWSLNSELPSGAVGWLVSIRSEGNYRILVTLSQGDHKGLYETRNLKDWKQISTGIFRYSESYDHQQVIATDDLDPGASLLLNIDGQSTIGLPKGVIRAAGDFKKAFSVYGALDGKVGIMKPDNSEVSWSISKNIASLTAAPDFPSTNSILAGEFRGGIYKSRDSGQTWQEVLSNPNSIVLGTNEIVDIKYLSQINVVAVNGGDLQWIDY